MVFDEATINRFWSKVDKRGPDDCWLWLAHTNGPRPYGRFTTSNKRFVSSRLAYMLANDVQSLPCDLLVCHTCDNPQCCNPSHLWLGTTKDNTRDCIEKGRFPRLSPLRGERRPGSLLKAWQVHLIRDLLNDQYSQHTIAKALGVSRSAIQSIHERKSWAWL